MEKRSHVFCALIGVVFLWGTSFPAIKIALASYSPLELATLRFLFASLAFLVFYYKRKIRVPDLKDIPLFIALAIVGMVGYHLLINYGEKLTNAGTTGFIVNIAPVFTLFLSYIFFKEKITANKIIGSMLALLGVWLISIANGTTMKMNYGIIILLVAALCWGMFFILQKLLLQRYSSLETISYAIWISAIVFLVLSNPITLFHHMFRQNLYPTCAIIYLGAFSTSIAYWLWAYVLTHMEVSKASIYTYSVPFISAILSYFLLDEHYSVWFIFGGTFIVSGIFLQKINLANFKVGHLSLFKVK